MLKMVELIKKLAAERRLTLDEYKALIEGYNEENANLLASLAVAERKKHYSNSVFIRGLIEISNICKRKILIIRTVLPILETETHIELNLHKRRGCFLSFIFL